LAFARPVTVACALVVGLAVPAAASGATFYVDGAVGATGDCLSPATACKTIADAIPKERGTAEADTINVAPGTYDEHVKVDMAVDGGLTIAGAGAGSDPSTNTLLQSTSGGLPVVWAQFPDTLLNIRGVRVVVAGTATGQAIYAGGAAYTIGSPAAPVVVDMANASNNSYAVGTSGPAGSQSRLDHVTIGGAWTGDGLYGGKDTTIADSRIVTSPGGTGTPGYLDGPGATLFQRSVLQRGNPSGGPAVSSTKLDVTIDSSEVLGGGAFLSPGGAATRTLTVASSTIDAGVLGNRDSSTTYPSVTVDPSGAGAAANVNVEGSILIEAPKATVSGGASATVTCTSTEVVGTSQAPSSTLGQIDCATGTSGNTFTPSLGDLFANAAPDYTLRPGSSAVDSVPESAITAPAGVTLSATDFAGASRVVNGVGTCAAPVRDKGALELAGHAGVVPDATIGGPAGAVAGSPAAFSGSAPNQPPGTPLTFDWSFSDGTTATGAAVSHAFAAAGPASAMLTVTAPGACVGTATKPLTVTAAPAKLDAITGLKITPSAFFARSSGPSVVAARRATGAIVSYTGTQAATTTFTVQRARTGRKRGKACRRPSRANRRGKRCTYYTGAGSFKRVDAAGVVRFRFTGRVNGHTLKPGRYRLKAVPRNAAGSGRAAYAKFRIKS
jgi:hypothetical protein